MTVFMTRKAKWPNDARNGDFKMNDDLRLNDLQPEFGPESQIMMKNDRKVS